MQHMQCTWQEEIEKHGLCILKVVNRNIRTVRGGELHDTKLTIVIEICI